MTYKKPCEIMYHIFADNFDELKNDLEEVLLMLGDLQSEGKDNIRIYKQTEWNEEDGIFEDGDCIYSQGDYPI